MTHILEYFQIIQGLSASRKHPTVEEIVMRYGKQYEPPKSPRPRGIHKGTYRMCYSNSYYLAMRQDWTYVEGFAIASSDLLLPLQHAWVLDERGTVVETTWKTAGIEYYGIAFKSSFIHKVMIETKRFGILDPSSPSFRARFYLPFPKPEQLST